MTASKDSRGVLVCTRSVSTAKTLRAMCMAIGLPPTEPLPTQDMWGQIVRHLAEHPAWVALLDLDTWFPDPASLWGLAQDPAAGPVLGRILLVRESLGLHPMERQAVTDAAFSGIWTDLDPLWLAQPEHGLPAAVAQLAGHEGPPAGRLRQFFSAMQLRSDPASPRHRIRHATGLSAEALCQGLYGGVKAIDRTYLLKTYPACITGVQAVDWLAQTFRLTRKTAEQMGMDLQSLRLLHHVVHEQPFADQPNFFRMSIATAAERLRLGPVLRLISQPSGVEVKDRSYRGKTYPACFVGSAAVDWMEATQKLRRHEAEIVLNRMQNFGAIRHVTDDHPVRDGHFFYRFTTQVLP